MFPLALFPFVALPFATGEADPAGAKGSLLPPVGRYEKVAPLPGLPAVTVDTLNCSIGEAQQTAKSRNLQARILWIDATANINRINSDDKIAALVEKVANTGFNTIVLDVKPIVGWTLYKGTIAPKLTEWRGQTLGRFDPLDSMVRHAKRVGIPLFASLNAFSEGHRDVEKGPGYDHPEWQTVLYEPDGQVRSTGYYQMAFGLMDRTNTAPQNDDALGVFTDLGRLSRVNGGSRMALVDAGGTVLAQWDSSSGRPAGLAIPPGGSVLVGIGKAAEYLRINAKPNDRLEFDCVSQFVPIGKKPWLQVPLMVNPNDAAVRSRALAILRELVAKYPVDGVVYDDRLRYSGLNADFSFATRDQFEKYVGQRIVWPDDVFRWTLLPDLSRGVVPGKFYDAWLTFRAQTICSFVAEARAVIDATRPGTLFGVYAGSTYGEYTNQGANYAAPDFEAGFRFLTPAYQRAGFANYLDFFIPGCYYARATVTEAMAANAGVGFTVEAAGQLANRAVRDQAWVYAGIAVDRFRGDQTLLKNALQAATASTQGVMVFDLSHDLDPLWPVFEQAFAQKAQAPHAVPGLLAEVRKKRAQLDKLGVKEPPVIISAGAAGTGL